MVIESSKLNIPHHHLDGVLGGGLDVHLALHAHPGEGGVYLGDAGEDPPGVGVDVLLAGGEVLVGGDTGQTCEKEEELHPQPCLSLELISPLQISPHILKNCSPSSLVFDELCPRAS